MVFSLFVEEADEGAPLDLKGNLSALMIRACRVDILSQFAKRGNNLRVVAGSCVLTYEGISRSAYDTPIGKGGGGGYVGEGGDDGGNGGKGKHRTDYRDTGLALGGLGYRHRHIGLKEG